MNDLNNISIAKLRQRTGEKWSDYDDEVLPAWVADMDFEVALPIRQALLRSIEASDLGYPISVQRYGLTTLFAERVAREFDWQVEPREVEVINDVVQGIYACLLGLSHAGEGAIIQTPIYPPFLRAVKETGRQGVLCPLVKGTDRFEIDFDAMHQALQGLGNTRPRLLLFCNPHNPSGRAFDRKELEGIAEIVLEYDLLIVSDEIHADLVLGGASHIPIATLGPEIAERTVTLMSASKAFNIAGLCIAFAHFGSATLRKGFNSIPRHFRGGVNALSMAAAKAAWTDGQPWLEAVRGQLRDNRDQVDHFVTTRWPDITHCPPDATYLAWLNCRALNLAPDPYRFFLNEARVALSDGAAFGEPGQGFVRLNFATTPEILATVLSRMDDALARR